MPPGPIGGVASTRWAMGREGAVNLFALVNIRMKKKRSHRFFPSGCYGWSRNRRPFQTGGKLNP
jgi:hypothetical protein